MGFKSSFAFKAAKNIHDQEMKIVVFFLVHGMGEGDVGGGGGWRMKGKRGYSLLCSWMTNFVFYRSSYESCSSCHF